MAETGIWIGRARDCRISLDDPERFVSSYHARIDCLNGAFWLTDQSSNGTYVNGSPARLIKHQRYPLTDGDIIKIGMFALTVGTGMSGSRLAEPQFPAAGELGGAAASLADPLALFASSGSAALSQGAPESLEQYSHGAADHIDQLLGDLFPASQPAALPRFEAPTAEPGGAGILATAGGQTNTDGQRDAEAISQSAVSGGAGPAGDMLAVIAAEVADLTPALRRDEVPNRDYGTALAADTAVSALAAFWCGLGIIPRSLSATDLVDVMADLGAAFREAADGLAQMALNQAPQLNAQSNPLLTGHPGLRRAIEEGGPHGTPLSEAVRDVLTQLAARDLVCQEAVQAGVKGMAQSLSARALEARLGATITTSWPRARRAELWRMFSLLEADLLALAELRFREDFQERLRRPAATPERGVNGHAL